jgi:hypothetical protein
VTTLSTGLVPRETAAAPAKSLPLVVVSPMAIAVAAGALSGALDERAAGGFNWLSPAYSLWEGWTCVTVSDEPLAQVSLGRASGDRAVLPGRRARTPAARSAQCVVRVKWPDGESNRISLAGIERRDRQPAGQVRPVPVLRAE